MDVRAGRSDKTESDEQQYNLMRSLLARYGQPDDVLINPMRNTDSNSEGIAVSRLTLSKSNYRLTCLLQILTGATGALGAHILAELVARTRIHVIALVRATDDEDASQRLSENLRDRKLDTIDNTRYSAAASTLSGEQLGLSNTLYEKLLAETVLIIHVCHLISLLPWYTEQSYRLLGQSILRITWRASPLFLKVSDHAYAYTLLSH